MITALLIAIAWFVPSIVRSLNPRPQQLTKSKPLNDSPSKAVSNYINELARKSDEEIARELNKETPENPYAITKVEVNETTYNAEKAKVEAKVYNYNSYWDTTFLLDRVEESTPSEDNPKVTWKISDKEVGEELKFSNAGLTLIHGTNWQAVPRDMGGEFIAQWSLQPTDETKNIDLMFAVEESTGQFAKQLVNCSAEEITNCSEENLGELTAQTATYSNGVVKLYLLETETRNYLIIRPVVEEEYPEEDQQMNDIINSITLVP
jgi:hypothetical protein